MAAEICLLCSCANTVEHLQWLHAPISWGESPPPNIGIVVLTLSPAWPAQVPCEFLHRKHPSLRSAHHLQVKSAHAALVVCRYLLVCIDQVGPALHRRWMCNSLHLQEALEQFLPQATLQQHASTICLSTSSQPAERVSFMQMPKGWRWLNRVSPATWIIYGLAVDQLGESQSMMTTPDGHQTTVAHFMNYYFGYDYGFRW